MINTLSNTINIDVCRDQYQFDPVLAALMVILISKINLPVIKRKQITVVVKHRPRNPQSLQLLEKLKSSLVKCQHKDWLAKRNVIDLSNIYSIDYNKLSKQDLLDLYLCPVDYILDEFGEQPIEGPVFLDIRNNQLCGVCVRNCTTDKEYAAAAKYTFSNYGWFLWGYDLYSQDDKVYIVEGVFDAIAMRANNYKAMALGSAYPSVFQLACLAYKFKNLTICFDNDFWGHYGAYVASLCLKAKIVIPELKDVSVYYENNKPIELRNIDRKELKAQLCNEINGYNKIVESGGDLIRDLPYN